jgi:hypothetical protein
MLAWRSHVEGAVQIIKARGREQMRMSKTSSLLFSAVRRELVKQTFTTGQPSQASSAA